MAESAENTFGFALGIDAYVIVGRSGAVCGAQRELVSAESQGKSAGEAERDSAFGAPDVEVQSIERSNRAEQVSR